jgi:hypothetical protein
MPEASQRSAHCRLTEMESVTRTRDVTLGQQRIKRHEQVQIEEVQVHSVTIGWLRLRSRLSCCQVYEPARQHSQYCCGLWTVPHGNTPDNIKRNAKDDGCNP